MTGSAGRRVLVVEDEAVIVMLLEDMLTVLGYEVAGTAYRLAEALTAAEKIDFDLAILDINLNGEASFPVAKALRARGIPFLFATGYDPARYAEDFGDAVILRKPFSLEDLAQTIDATLGRRAGPSQS